MSMNPHPDEQAREAAMSDKAMEELLADVAELICYGLLRDDKTNRNFVREHLTRRLLPLLEAGQAMRDCRFAKGEDCGGQDVNTAENCAAWDAAALQAAKGSGS